jgi:serine/threonine protein kinase
MTEAPEYFSGNMSGGNLRTITYFDYATLKKATKDFHQKRQLGRGGFGPVYLVRFFSPPKKNIAKSYCVVRSSSSSTQVISFTCTSATVDQGKLDDGRKVAVKQLSVGKSGQGESEFFVEVNMITSIQHKNLVLLVGCCSEGTQRLLVYEFMKNKSLDKILFGKHTMINMSVAVAVGGGK